MPQALTPEWGLNIQNQVPVTSRPDFLLSSWDRRAELNSFTAGTKHPGSKPGFAHGRHHRQTELREHVIEQAVVLPESQVPPIIEGVEAIDAPLMAAVFFSTLANNEFVKKNGPRLAVIALALALTTCLPQQSTPTPEIPPAVVVVTNTPLPDLGLIQPSTPAETPFFGAGGPEFTLDIGLKLEQLTEANLSLPVCDQFANQSADREKWESEKAAGIEAKGGDIQWLYSLLRPELPAGAQIRLCVNSEGWYFRVTTADGAPVWNQIKGEGGQWRWADHPNQIPVDENGNIGQWQMMRLPGPISDFAPLVIAGVPAEIQLGRDGRPTAYFNPLTGEWISLEPEATATPVRTATATPTITNTPRPTAIPATRIPPTAVSTPTLESFPTVTPTPASSELWSSTFKVQPTLEELKLCTTGTTEQPIDGSNEYYSRFKGDHITAIDGNVITYNGGERIDLTQFGVSYVYQADSNRATRFEYLPQDLIDVIKPGDFVYTYWSPTGTPTHFYLFCRAK